MKAIGFELKQAARRVFTWKQTGAIMIPAIGLALATIMFAVGWSYSSLSLLYKDAGQLVVVGYVEIGEPMLTTFRAPNEPVPWLNGSSLPFFDWKERKDVFTDVAAMRTHYGSYGSSGVIAKTPNGNVVLELDNATVNYFDVLGVSFPGIQAWKASLGSKTPLSVVLPYKAGVKYFDYPEIGQEFRTHDKDTILAANGVLPANFVLPDGSSNERGFVPFEPERNADIRQLEGLTIGPPLTVIGRLAPGMTPQLAEQILTSTSSGEIEEAFGRFYKIRLAVRPVTGIIANSSRQVVGGAWILGALTLLLCTANLAGLMLVRCVYNLREYAMRSAFGARFSDLLRMMLLELFLLSIVAAVIAAYIARVAMPAIAERVPVKSMAFGLPVFDREAVVFLIAATLFVAVASGLLSVVALARNYYKGFSQGIFAVFHSHRMPRILLTISQTAIATILLCLSWMTVRGYLDLFSNEPGVDTNIRIVEVLTPPQETLVLGQSFVLDMLDRVRGGDPDVRIGVMSTIGRDMPFTSQDGTRLEADHNMISPGLFRTLKVEILAGHDFTEQDRADLLIINESLARRMGWPVGEAIGKQLTPMLSLGGGGITSTVIGVVRDFQNNGLDDKISPMVFQSMRQQINETQISSIVFRIGFFRLVIHPDAMARVGNIERTIIGIAPDAVFTRNATWRDLLGDSVRGRTFATFSVTLFTIAAIAIVVIGIVGTITFIVARRMRDIAIQIAVGAPSYRVCWFVVKDMVIAGVIGALIGGIASWWAGKAVAHYIYNGEKYQNLTGLAIATVIMLAIIAAAALLPAWRATRIEPGRILNME